MDKTSNYNLNQWSKDDRVLMEDFNADNAKLDAAIDQVDGRVDGLAESKADKTAVTALQGRMTAAEAKAGARLIQRGTPLGAESGVYTVSFAGVDWSQWKTIYLLLTIKANTSNISIGRNSVQHQAKAYPGKKLLIFYPFFDGDTSAVGVNPVADIGENFVSLGGAYKSAELVLHTYNNEKLLPGTTYEFWGER
ncbi:MAG: hypothetical protein HFF55_08110 [Lawsonibacter sp.]|jgi:hypothetical protein|nr:hypothetical protein [Lawsonibacter sp.]MCI9158947.1 hypothetical protein [Lawsonibacter sp.]